MQSKLQKSLLLMAIASGLFTPLALAEPENIEETAEADRMQHVSPSEPAKSSQWMKLGSFTEPGIAPDSLTAATPDSLEPAAANTTEPNSEILQAVSTNANDLQERTETISTPLISVDEAVIRAIQVALDNPDALVVDQLIKDRAAAGSSEFKSLDLDIFSVADSILAQATDDTAAQAQPASGDLAQQSQNPIASLISVPFQNNTNFGVGEFNRTSNVLNIQPVIPVPLSANLSLVNRTIIPVSYQPELGPGIDDAFGLGDIVYQGFLVPQSSGNFTWGVGPILSFPTGTDTILGSGKWSAGPNFVGLVTTKRIVTGALINQLWSFAGDNDREPVSFFSIQPFFNYNFDGGWYLSTAPTITANWNADADDVWTLPIGGGPGRVFNIGKQPVNMSLRGYWNAIAPDNGPDWTLQFQATLLFP